MTTIDDEKFKALLSTAELFKNFSRKAVAAQGTLQAETLIVATARMAGTLLYQTFDLPSTFSPGTIMLTEKANVFGPKLMNVMIVTLQHLGHKEFVESSIDAKFDFKEIFQIDFEATQKRLGSFFQLCFQSEGLSHFDAAMAAAIATAINIHDCRDVLDIHKGAAIAVWGFIEGTKTAPHSLSAKASPSGIELSSQTVEQLSDSERFDGLAKTYHGYVITAFDNLALIKLGQAKIDQTGKLSSDLVAKMRPFSLDVAGGYLARKSGEKTSTIILGEFDDKATFHSTITEMILKINAVAISINAAMAGTGPVTTHLIVRPLQEVITDFLFLAKTFEFYGRKSRLLDGQIGNAINRRPEIQAALQTYFESFNTDFAKVAKCCIDMDHLNSKIRKYRFKNCSWITYNVGPEGRSVNSYFLPEQYWKTYITQADESTRIPKTAFKNQKIPEKDRQRISQIVTHEKIHAVSSAIHRFHIPSYWTTNSALGVSLIHIGGGGTPDDMYRRPYCVLLIGDDVVVFNVANSSTETSDLRTRGIETVYVSNIVIPPKLGSRRAAINQLISDGLKESANLDARAVGLAVANSSAATPRMIATEIEFM